MPEMIVDSVPLSRHAGRPMLLEQDAAAGMRRAPAETSSEYVERVIGASSVDPRPIADLGALFREARFSSRPILLLSLLGSDADPAIPVLGRVPGCRR